MADQDTKVADTAVETKEDVEEIEEINTQGKAAGGDASAIAASLMKDPRMLAAMQQKMMGLIGTPSGYIASLPKPVKRRLKALKKLQFKMIEVESKFYEEVHELECRYASLYAPLCSRRSDVTSGAVEPTDSDCDWPSEDEDEEEIAGEQMQKAKITEIDETKTNGEAGGDADDKKDETDDSSASGVSEFWLTVFKNVDLLAEMIQEHDQPILKHLIDLKVHFTKQDKATGEEMGFQLEFVFSENEFFTNSSLTKTYVMRAEPDEEDPFSFEGPEIIKCKGCAIDWNKGKNVTIKIIKKKQKHKGRGTTRTVTKTVQNDSFFNFFSPPEQPENEDEENEDDEDVEALLAADYEIGHFLRERIVPRAVLYFTGEALDEDEDDEDDYDDEGDEEGDEEEDEDEDADYDPKSQPGGEKPADCKQQ